MVYIYIYSKCNKVIVTTNETEPNKYKRRQSFSTYFYFTLKETRKAERVFSAWAANKKEQR